jgi:hypothetical protein
MLAGNMKGLEEGATVIASTPVMPRATITVLDAAGSAAPKGPISVFPLPFVIGRTEGALVIQNPNISRKHAQITFDVAQHTYLITDLNSSNGTTVNAQRLVPGQGARLSSGVVIGLGPNITLRFDLS